MIRSTILFSALISATLITACSKSDDSSVTSGNGTGQSQFHYQLKATNKTVGVAQKTSANGTIQWTSGFANPKLVKFEAKQNGSEIEYKSTNTGQIDLMAALGTSFGNFTIPAGTYNEIELKIQLDKNGGSPALSLTGQFSNTTTTFPVSFVVNDLVELKTEQKNVTIGGNSSFTAATTLDLSAFTTGLTEAALLAAQQTNGGVVISSSQNVALYNAILSNLKNKSHHVEIEHD